MATELTAHATRSGAWWAITVPELPGLFTQVKRLNNATAMVLDAAEALTEHPASEFVVTVVADLPAVDQEAIEAARASVVAARQAQEEAITRQREAARRLLREGLTQREVAVLLGISHQRVDQLAS